MTQYLTFMLLGLGNGAVYAALAVALVVCYRSSGVINFATGAIALYAAYTYAALRDGQLLLLIPGLPDKLDLGTRLGFGPAAVSRSCSRNDRRPAVADRVSSLRRATPVAKAVASSACDTAHRPGRSAPAPRRSWSLAPARHTLFGDVTVPADRFWLAVAVVLSRSRSVPCTASPASGWRHRKPNSEPLSAASRTQRGVGELGDQRNGRGLGRHPDRTAGPARAGHVHCSSSPPWRLRSSASSRCSSGDDRRLSRISIKRCACRPVTWVPRSGSPVDPLVCLRRARRPWPPAAAAARSSSRASGAPAATAAADPHSRGLRGRVVALFALQGATAPP